MMAVSTDNSKSSGSKTSNSAKTSSGTSKVSAADLDTVRMYLSHIGSVDLLSRDEEVEIAMQIEEARDAVIDAALSTQHGVNYILDMKAIRKGDDLFEVASMAVLTKVLMKKKDRLELNGLN